MIVYVLAGKGGVGKTATVINLAAYAAQQGHKVAVCDNDPQGTGNAHNTVLNLRGVRASDAVETRDDELLFVDCPVSLSREIRTAGRAQKEFRRADMVLLPIEPIQDSLTGNIRIVDFLGEMPHRSFVTQFRAQSSDDREFRASAWKLWPKTMCRTTVPFHRAIREAQNRNKSVFDYAPDSIGARAYKRLFDELFRG